MKTYELLMLLKNDCERRAAATSDNAFRTFYAHVAEYYENKAKNLTLLEAAND